MSTLALGLLVFLGTHSIRVVADGGRTRAVARIGELPWKGLYALVSLFGFWLIVRGYAEARTQPVVLWVPPVWARHAVALFMLPAMTLLIAAYVPGNGIKARLRHPMLIGTVIWALGHLLANSMLADLVLFGAFLLWAAVDYGSARARDRASPVSTAPSRVSMTALTVVLGTGAWLAMIAWAHVRLFGVAPLAMP